MHSWETCSIAEAVPTSVEDSVPYDAGGKSPRLSFDAVFAPSSGVLSLDALSLQATSICRLSCRSRLGAGGSFWHLAGSSGEASASQIDASPHSAKICGACSLYSTSLFSFVLLAGFQ